MASPDDNLDLPGSDDARDDADQDLTPRTDTPVDGDGADPLAPLDGEDPHLPMDEGQPGLRDEDPVVVDGDPVVVDEDPVVVDGDPVVVDEDPVVVDGDPVVVDGDPVVVDGDPVVDGGAAGDDGLDLADDSSPGPVIAAPLPEGEHDHEPEAGRGTGRRDSLIIGIVLLALVGVLAFVLLTRGGSQPAYTVYDEEVSRETLQADLEGLVEEELITVAGSIEDATPEQRAALAQAMSTVITADVMTRAAEEEGITVDDADVDAQVEEIIAGTFGGDREAFDAQLEEAGISEDGVRTQFRVALLAEQLVADSVPEVDDAAIQEAYDANFSEPTVAHILTETEDEALAALERIEGGEEFSAVAQEVSTDPGSGAQGGELGPLVPGQFVPEFEEAALALEPGEISDPVETQFGFHLITVGEPLPLEDVREQIAQQLEDQNLNAGFMELAAELDEAADVTVDPAYGTWGGLAQGLVPPQQELPLGEGAPPPGQAPAGEGAPPAEGAAPPVEEQPLPTEG